MAQHLGLQDIWDLWEPQGHPGKLSHFRDDPLAHWHTSGMLAHWHTCWHSRQTHGIQTNDEHTASHSGRLQTPGSCGQFMVSQVYVDLSQNTQKLPQPNKLKNMVKTDKFNKFSLKLSYELAELEFKPNEFMAHKLINMPKTK